MEQEPSEAQRLEPSPFRVFWHKKCLDDLSSIHPVHANAIVRGSEHKLSKAPQLLGAPLKGTYQKLWKVPFSKYRAVYTINESAKEVWVLCVEPRNKVYRKENIEALLRLALALNTGRFMK